METNVWVILTRLNLQCENVVFNTRIQYLSHDYLKDLNLFIFIHEFLSHISLI
jgi:hypothetical protein